MTKEERKEYNKQWRALHREEERARHMQWRKDNPEKWAALLARYKARHPTGQADYDRARRLADPQWKEKHAAKMREHRRTNPNWRLKHNAWTAARRALSIMAMPPWVKREEIATFYVEADRQTLITGVPHEVDHIWPLHGEGFVGLHVPWNLRVITKVANIKKKNRNPTREESLW